MLDINAKRPIELRRILEGSERQIDCARERYDRISYELKRAQKLRLISFAELNQIGQVADLELQAGYLRRIARFRADTQQISDNLDHLETTMRMHLHNMQIQRKYLLRYNAEEYQFSSRLHKHDYMLMRLQRSAEVIHQAKLLCDELAQLAKQIRDEACVARHEKRQLRCLAEYAAAEQKLAELQNILQTLKS